MSAMLKRKIDRQFLTTKSMPHFPTEIIHKGPLFSLSDIHGDIHAFIISLRDCAKVIRKKTDSTPLNPDIVDPDIERNLIINIGNGVDGVATTGDYYDVSLGYEWCGGNTHVVICGDFIDPNRQEGNAPTCSKHPCVGGIPCNCTYYQQQEIKLLLFINELNRQAMLFSGRIIKLLGNHEVKNILSYNGNTYQDRYTFLPDRELGNDYYLGDNRKETFNINKQGYNLLFKDGCGLIVKINNTIFVHGKINKTDNLFTINDANQYINNPDESDDSKKELFIQYDRGDGILNNREWGTYNIYPIIMEDPVELNKFYTDVKETIQFFLMLQKLDDIIKYRVVIGHCTQFDSSILNGFNTTFSNLFHEDEKSKTYNGSTYKLDKSTFDNQDFIFGITMEVPKEPVNDLIDFYLYRVDVGSSREFDKGESGIFYQQDGIPPVPIQAENQLLFSKTPQVLAIHKDDYNNDIVTIIKSKMWNTRKHLPRQYYEYLLGKTYTVTEHKGKQLRVGLKTLTDRTNYDKKYLKYKKKYLDLKKSN